MEKLIAERLYHPSTEVKALPNTAFRLTKGPIDAFRLSKKQGNDQAVIFFHGNKGNITWYGEKASHLLEKYPDADIWAFEYLGFGQIKGTPDTQKLVLGAYQFLSAIQKQYKRWIWVGESIGAPIALGVLTKLDDKAVLMLPEEILLINTFASIGEMADITQAGSSMWVKKFGYELNTEKYTRQIFEKYADRAPKLSVYRARGVTEVPVDQMVKVAAAAKCTLVLIDGDTDQWTLP